MNKVILYNQPPSEFDNWKLDIVTGSRKREWMDEHVHSYRCTPLAIANEFGWDIILPYDIEVEWNGGNHPSDLTVVSPNESKICVSHFGAGTVTFHPGFHMKTKELVYIMVGPVPNQFNQDFVSLSAIIETDKLNYPWFLSIRMLNTGNTKISAGTKLGRIIPINIKESLPTSFELENIPPEINNEVTEFSNTRTDSMAKGERWTKQYVESVEYTKVKLPDVTNSQILIRENFIDADTREQLLALIKNCPKDLNAGEYWKDKVRRIEYEHRISLQRRIQDEIQPHYTMIMLRGAMNFHGVVWDESDKNPGMPPHSDYGGANEFPEREYVSLLYLNDDYIGGELYIPEIEFTLKPKAGTLLCFPGGKLKHGVQPITSGARYTCIAWWK
tara:strand:- start:292 stop:1452 length:1161 start_codon:yes stop_codon:yes gene_type:complete